jgi:hypothetical protein
MAAKEFYHDIDLVKVSQLLNFRVHNITTTDRGTLGGTLSGSHTGLTVYDTDLDCSVCLGWISMGRNRFSFRSHDIQGRCCLQRSRTGNASHRRLLCI